MTARAILDAERAASEARRSTAVHVLVRSGYGASAVLRALIGTFIVLLAVRPGGPAADASGAFGTIAAAPGGVVLLVLLASAEFALAAWLLAIGAVHHHAEPLERWRLRLVWWGRAAVYAVIGATALRSAIGVRQASAAFDRDASRALLAVPGGAVVLLLIGAVVVVTGTGMAWIGAFLRFPKTIRLPRGEGRRRAVLGIGVVGYVLQGATIALVGGFLVAAAFADRAGRTVGLDGTLGSFTNSAGGRVLLIVLGAGWVVAAVYAGLRAFLARLD